MPSAQRFKQISVPRQPGELARLKVVDGPDSGTTYVIMGIEASIGRGDENDIVLSDLKASRKHAKLARGAEGWSVRDLGSSNGILHNGEFASSADLGARDTITVGSTTLEFQDATTVSYGASLPSRSLSQIQAEQVAFDAQRQKVRALGKALRPGKPGAPIGLKMPTVSAGGKELLKNPKALGAIAVVLLVFLLLDSGPQKKKPANKEGQDARDIASVVPKAALPETMVRTVDMFLKTGLREYREKNYLRAKTQFENVLQITPGHELAQRYLENCNRAIDDEVKFHLDHGKKNMDAGKLKAARGHFEAVLRLLYRSTSSPEYAQAKEHLDKIEKSMLNGGDG